MTEDPDRRAMAESAMTLGVLDEQAVRVRAELAALSRTLETVQQALGEDRMAHLLAANEQLVRAALLADSIAEKALLSLAEMTRSRQDDGLPGLAAGTSRAAELEAAMAVARRRQTRLAVIFIGVDASGVRDGNPGRAAGDLVMQAATRRLESILRRADALSCEPGATFLTVFAEIAQFGDAPLVATKLVAALAAPVQVDGRPLRLTASVGIALYPLDGSVATRLLDLADEAMQRARQEGAGVVKYASERGALAGDGAPVVGAVRTAPTPASDLREVNERLLIAAVNSQQQQADREVRAHALQVRFLAMVAHELRNPLMPIRTATELLVKARGDEAMLVRLQGIIKRQVTQMSRLVDDLMDTSRITSGRFRLERERLELATVLTVARDACQPAIESRQQQLAWHVPAEPLTLYADPVRLAQVFSNLLDNASKYTPRGGKLMLVARAQDDEVLITVADDGRGISATAMLHVFDLFAQDPRTLAFGGGGLGIGLAVVRELVESHGGTIVVHSAGIDLGAEFAVTLPLATASLHA